LYSLKQAAEAVGRSKPTILRAIQGGKLSAAKDVNGRWTVDPAELHRVYAPAVAVSAPRTDTRTDAEGDAALQREVELLREMLAERAEVIDDLRRRLDQAEAERRQITLALTDQRPPAERRKRWWWWWK
jgi:hypothetical protein